jgi:3-oxoacyl-[acyl-carrier-protein] synthase-3
MRFSDQTVTTQKVVFQPVGCSPPGLARAMLSGTGSCLPARVLGNEDFPGTLNTSDEWIRTRTGIRQRRIAAPDENSFSLGLEASQLAIEHAGLTPRDIDLIICATVTPYKAVPANACLLQGALGCRAISAFDVAGACTGFLHGLSIAQQFIATGACQHVLVVGTEVLSRTLDYADRTTCILFGDAAGAAVLSASPAGDEEHGVRWVRLYSDGKRGELIAMPSHVTHRPPPYVPAPEGACDPYLRINGREVFKFAVRALIALVEEALRSCPLPNLERVFLVPHQVNQRIIEAALPELPIPADRIVLNLEHYGNTSAASVPVALDEALRRGVIGPGDHVVLAAFGGGLTWGGAFISL